MPCAQPGYDAEPYSSACEYMKTFSDLSQRPVILTGHVIRVYFYRLIEQFYPNIYVLSFNEIANNVQIQSIGNISA